jgi:hypothetical protein
MRKRFHLIFLAPVLLLTACGPSDQQKVDYSAVQSSGVSSAIYDKMIHGDALSVSDVAALSRAHVNDGIVIRYIRDHGTIYVLSQSEISYLQSNHVSPSVLDYMVQTSQNYGPGYPYGYPYGPYPYPPVSIGIGFGGGYYHHWR